MSDMIKDWLPIVVLIVLPIVMRPLIQLLTAHAKLTQSKDLKVVYETLAEMAGAVVLELEQRSVGALRYAQKGKLTASQADEMREHALQRIRAVAGDAFVKRAKTLLGDNLDDTLIALIESHVRQQKLAPKFEMLTTTLEGDDDAKVTSTVTRSSGMPPNDGEDESH